MGCKSVRAEEPPATPDDRLSCILLARLTGPFCAEGGLGREPESGAQIARSRVRPLPTLRSCCRAGRDLRCVLGWQDDGYRAHWVGDPGILVSGPRRGGAHRVPLREGGLHRELIAGEAGGTGQMSGLTNADITRMRDQLFFEGPERNRRLSRYWLLLPLAAIIASAGGGQRLHGHRDRGHDRGPADDPDPGNRAGRGAGRRGQSAPVPAAAGGRGGRRGSDRVASWTW
jgi:hypothetical protein